MGKKDGEEKLSKEEKAAKKAAKAAKRAAEEAAEAEPPKKVKTDDEKLSKEEKAAKKAAKAAKKETKAAEEFAPPVDEKAAKKAAKEAKRAAKAAAGDADDGTEKVAKKAKTEDAAAPAETSGDSEEARVFVGNLPFSMNDDWMKEVFQEAGAVTKMDWLNHADTGRWKGSGFLTFGSKAEAEKAVGLNGKEIEGRPMKVEIAAPRKAAPPGGIGGSGDPGEPSQSVFCGNLSWSVTEEALRGAFGECGDIARIKWLEKDGEFKGIAFIDFETVEAATKAVALAGTDVAGRPIRINFSKAKPQADKPAWGAKPAAGGRTERPYKPQGDKPDGCCELFCGNLPWTIDETKIAEFFKKAGVEVAGTRWLNDKETGEFKGIGFVSFNDTADVDKAVALGGENIEGRPIRLDYAGKKDPKKGAWQGGW